MEAKAIMTLFGFVMGGLFLLVALLSTRHKVTLVLFNPWLLRQVRYHDRPRTFAAIVLLYWLLGMLGVGAAVASCSGVFH